MAPCQEGTAMKRSDAVIRQGSLDEVRERLTNIGVEGLTLTEVIGFGRQKGHSEFYRGCEYKVDFDPKLMLTIVARDCAPRPPRHARPGKSNNRFGMKHKPR